MFEFTAAWQAHETYRVTEMALLSVVKRWLAYQRPRGGRHFDPAWWRYPTRRGSTQWFAKRAQIAGATAIVSLPAFVLVSAVLRFSEDRLRLVVAVVRRRKDCIGENKMSDGNFVELTASIVAAYVTHNSVQAVNLPSLIESVHAAVAKLDKVTEPQAPAKPPAVNPKRSVFPDYIISLEDGRRFKSIKRHLGLLGMSPQEYRVKWSLPADYPMVAPSYAAARSALAKSIGLGRKAGSTKTKIKRTKKA